MKGYLYILKSEKVGRYYIGSSLSPEKRLNLQHNLGYVKYTKPGIPWMLIFKQEYDSLTSARKIEYKLKNLKSKVIIERIINDGVCKLKVG